MEEQPPKRKKINTRPFKTIRGYIKHIRMLELRVIPSDLKGFSDLPENEQRILEGLDVDISNSINEIESFKQV